MTIELVEKITNESSNDSKIVVSNKHLFNDCFIHNYYYWYC